LKNSEAIFQGAAPLLKMIEVREVPSTDWEQLLNQGFPVPPGASFLHDFPVWDTVNFSGRAVATRGFALKDSDKYVAAAGLRFAKLRSPRGSVTIGLIGGVVADAAYQGQGLASRMIEALTAEAVARKVSGLVLWGSEHSLYQRLGFELMGVQRRISLSSVKTDAAALSGLRLGKGWTDSLWPAIESFRFLGLEISPQDRAWFASHPNVDWRWVSSPAGKILAYAAIGRGIDLPNIVHEWGGDARVLKALLATIAVDYPYGDLLVPSKDLTPSTLDLPAGIEESLCMARALDPAFPASKDLWFWGLDGA
jgi:predicted N-acetyltransferase YhbS